MSEYTPKEKTKTELTLAWIDACLNDIEKQTASANDMTTEEMLDAFDAINTFKKALAVRVDAKSSRLSKLFTKWKEVIVPGRFEDKNIKNQTREREDSTVYRVQVADKMNTGFKGDEETTYTAICAEHEGQILCAVDCPSTEDDKYAYEAALDSMMDTYGAGNVNLVTAYGRDAGILWLRANGFDSLIKESVNAQTLNSTAKLEIEAGRELPSEYFSEHHFKVATVVKV